MTKDKKTTTKNPTTSELLQRCILHFSMLGIPLREHELEDALQAAEKNSLSHLAFLDRLIGNLARQRRERSTERRIRAAKFAERKLLDEFDWNFNRKAFDRVQIEQLASGDFIRRRANLILVGQSGIGKSHVIQAIGMKACALGFRVVYRTSAQLITDLTASLADKSLPQRLRIYKNPDLLIIDEFGFDRIERLECPEAAHLLYKVIASRNQQRSTALVTNVDFDRWGEYLADGPLAMAFLDRLVEGAIILKLKGSSYRATKTRTKTPNSRPSHTNSQP
jgi:DNA replication protein DnaC